MYNLFEEEIPGVVAAKQATIDAPSASEATFFDVRNSFLHRISARPKILLYEDMIKWMIDNVNIEDRAKTTVKVIWSLKGMKELIQ